MTRIVALDFGSARCGVAISDPTGTLATPIDAVAKPASRKGFNRLVELIAEREAARVVVGLPVGLSGRETGQTKECRAFASRLVERLDIPVEVYDERFTTKIAAKSGDRRTSEDSRAAAVLLEDYLARHAEVGA